MFLRYFKNVAHSLEPWETPSHMASHLAPNYVQRSLNIAKRFKTVRFGCGYFLNFLKFNAACNVFNSFIGVDLLHYKI